MKHAKRSLLLVTCVALLGVGILLGAWMPRDDDFFALRKNFRIFGAAYEELVTGYVDPLDAEHLMRTGMEAMLAELDPYTTFIDEADNTDISIITRGRYGGVGLNVGRRGGQITVISPIEDASGYKQGVRAGDVITHVGDKPTDDLSLADVRTLLRGEPRTTVRITVKREGAPAPIEFTLTREQVKLENVTYSGFVGDGSGEDNVGYIKLERFTHEAGAEVRKALRDLMNERDLQGVVLDLRDNRGGLLDAAVDVSQLFVPRGSEIVSTRGRLPETKRSYRSDRTPMVPDVPLVVLVNGYSASASEIVAGAMQDLDRGVVMGVTTYGKGLVQVVRPLPHNTSLKMTTAKYYTPSGRSIQSINYSAGDTTVVPDSLSRTFETEGGRSVRDQHGIEPDVEVSPGEPSELEMALQRRAAFFFYANHFAAENETLPDDFRVTDETLNAFQTWLAETDFEFPTDAEHAIDQLGEHILASGYAEVEDELATLREAVQDEKQDDFDQHAEALKQHLEREILARYRSESDQIQAMLVYDVQMREAARLLNDEDAYAKVLAP